jgi:DNA-binding transcriptional ArsR family regulator
VLDGNEPYALLAPIGVDDDFEASVVEPPGVPALSAVEGSEVEPPGVSEVEPPAGPAPRPADGGDVERGQPIRPPQLRELVALADALHCDVRPRVMLYLAEHGPTCVGDLAAALAIDQKVLSGHLAKLKDKNLLDFTRQSRRVFYQLADDNVTYRRENGEAHLVLSRGGGVKLTVTVLNAPSVGKESRYE